MKSTDLDSLSKWLVDQNSECQQLDWESEIRRSNDDDFVQKYSVIEGDLFQLHSKRCSVKNSVVEKLETVIEFVWSKFNLEMPNTRNFVTQLKFGPWLSEPNFDGLAPEDMLRSTVNEIESVKLRSFASECADLRGAIEVWEATHSWVEANKFLGRPHSDKKATVMELNRFAKKNSINISKGKPGRRKGT